MIFSRPYPIWCLLLVTACVTGHRGYAEQPATQRVDSLPVASEKLAGAVVAGDAEAVAAALDEGESPDAVSLFRRDADVPILIQAILTGRTPVAHLLRERGAVVPARYLPLLTKTVRQSPLYGNENVGLLALEFGAEVDERALIAVARKRGFARLLDELLKRDLEVNSVDESGRTSFDEAVRFRNFDAAVRLLDSGADPAWGETDESLYGCLRAGQSDLANTILKSPRVDLDSELATRLLAATVYFGRCQPEMAMYLLKQGADPSLHDASALLRMSVDLPPLEKVLAVRSRSLYDTFKTSGHSAAAEAFASRVTGVNQRDDAGTTRLIEAVKQGRTDEVERLLEDEAWLELTDANHGRSPLLWAVREGRTAVVEQLIQAGASPDVSDADGDTALMLAIRHDRADLIPTLLAAGAAVDKPAADGVTPLELARSLKKAQIADQLQAFIAAAASAEWTEDYEAAVADAKQRGLPLLLMFTGSDWCGFCVMLERDILSTPTFLAQAAGRLVLVKLDFPRGAKQPQAVIERNLKLKKRYADERGSLGYPTLILISPDGQELARRSGYSPTSRSEWLAWFAEVLAKHAPESSPQSR